MGVDRGEIGLQPLRVALQRVGVAQHEADRVVQFMRHAGHQTAERGHFFRMQQLLLRAFQVFVRFAQGLIGAAQFAQRPAGDHHADAHALMVDARRAVQRDRHDAVVGGAQRQFAIGQVAVFLTDEDALGGMARVGIGEQVEQRAADQLLPPACRKTAPARG
jgi:hypothetical protein